MKPLLSSEIAILADLGVTVAFAFFSQRFKWAKYIGPALICVIGGVILLNFNILPHWHNIMGRYCT
jgi:drug/metabolite transporter (DMT)-like permease